MATIQQVIGGLRKRKEVKLNRYIQGRPQISGVVLAITIWKPKKPNSARRAVAKVKLSNGEVTFAYIPGEKHKLQVHSRVLIRGGSRKDIVGVDFIVVRGAKGYDCDGVSARSTARSRYGVKRKVS